MDSSNEKISKPSVFIPTEQFDDPKVTSLEPHLKKRQTQYTASDAPPPAGVEAVAAVEQKPVPLQQEIPIRQEEPPNHHILETKEPLATVSDEIVETAPHVFTEQIELPENDLNELQDRILERIQSSMDEEPSPAADIPEVETPKPGIDVPAAISAGLSGDVPEQAQTTETESTQETVAEFTPPLIYTNKAKEGETIESLQRWLDKSPEEEKGFSTPVVVGLCVGMIAIGSLAGGLIVAAFTASEKKEAARKAELKRQKEAAYQDYRSQLASSRSYQLPPKGQSTIKLSSSARKRNSGGGGGGGGKEPQAKAAVLLAIPTLAAATPCVSKPKVSLEPLSGGRTKVAIGSACHGEQQINLTYAGVTFKKPLDQNGDLTFVLDLFAGDKENIEITFPDKSRVVKKPVAKDLNKVSKVAIIWNDPINLDLHAFEYSANETETGHIWEKHPSNFRQAVEIKDRTGLGRGFMSTASTDKSDNPKVEVYTFIKAAEQTQGVIKLALNHQASVAATGRVAGCSPRESRTVDYTTMQLKQNRTLKTGQAAFVIEPCSTQVIAGNHLNARAIQDLVIGR